MGRFKQTVRKSTPGIARDKITIIDNDGNVSIHSLNNQKDRIEAIQDQMRQASNLITLAFMDMEIVRQKLDLASSLMHQMKNIVQIVRQKLDLASSLMHQMKNIVRDMYDEEFKSDVEEIQQPEENSKQVNE